MYTQTLYELSQEAERLLQLSRQQLQLLEKIPLSVPGDDAPQLALPWSQPNIAERHAMLNNELRKISRLEMVLAIVGTMKAGKSTTINAIVGTEVLPNRNRPMTALPTLIRHTPGQKEPVLHFSHVAPIDHLIQQLQQRLRDCDIKHLTDVLEIDKDMRALMQRIENGIAFEKYYLGAQPIFHCLKSLNDLVRLAKALDVDFPFSAYAAIEHIPVIEVEFVHLAGLESYPGQLTLLDTPGPNEAGQPHLQKMLNQQLARASAVLAVLDYTQLKSISDCIVLLTEKDVWIRVNGKEPISLKANHMALLNCENNIIDVSSLNNTLVAHISHDIIKDYLRFLNKDLSQIPVWQRSATPILTLPCLTPDVFRVAAQHSMMPAETESEKERTRALLFTVLSRFLDSKKFLSLMMYMLRNCVSDSVYQIIESDIHKDWNLSMVASCLCLSPSLLKKKLKSENTSYSQIITTCRMRYAVNELMMDGKNISQVSQSCGYNSTSYFISVFKDFYGMTPLHYVSQHRERTVA